jgi:lipopolysaccharide assembly protein A
MQIIRTLVWVLILVVLLVFTAFNWRPVEVTIWTNTVLETKIPALAITAFLLGLVPMWLIHRGTKWRLERRIAALESAARVGSRSRAPTQPDALAPAAPPAPTRPTTEPADPFAPAPTSPASSAPASPTTATPNP